MGTDRDRLLKRGLLSASIRVHPGHPRFIERKPSRRGVPPESGPVEDCPRCAMDFYASHLRPRHHLRFAEPRMSPRHHGPVARPPVSALNFSIAIAGLIGMARAAMESPTSCSHATGKPPQYIALNLRDRKEDGQATSRHARSFPFPCPKGMRMETRTDDPLSLWRAS